MMANILDEATMPSTDDIRVGIITGALDLEERIAIYRSDPGRFVLDEALSQPRVTHWREALGFESESEMEARLDSLGISKDDLPYLFGHLEPDAKDEIPPWWPICEAVLNEPFPIDDPELNRFLSKEDERLIPFEEVIAPWVRVGTRLLSEKVKVLLDDLEPEIVRKEQRGLAENIASIVRLIFVGDLETFKMQSYDSNDLFLGMTIEKPPNEAYLRFTSSILQDGWRSYMLKYPALACLLAQRVQLWVESFGEILERLDADREDLERLFSPDSSLGRLVKGGRGISDSHNGGRAVVVCEFENGCKIVYKPRPMSVDSAWGKLVDWFNGRFDDIDSIVKLDVLDRGNYGWMTFAEYKPCSDAEEIETYFRRMGIFLCLVHLLHGNDFHLENVIASGPNPIAIDLETITVPHVEPPTPEGALGNSPARDLFGRSVLRTLLLPMAMAPGRAEARNLGAIGLNVDAGGASVQRVLHAINTDFMHWRTVSMEEAEKLGATNMADAMRSKVTLADGTEVVPQDHQQELMDGYEKTYKRLMTVRDEIVAEDGPLSFFKDAYVRFLNRATNVYYRLVFETATEKVMRSGVDRWIAIDRLAIGFSKDETFDKEMGEYLLKEEHDGIKRADIPYFLARGGSLKICTLDIANCNPIEFEKDLLTISAIDASKKQFQGMSDVDLARQLDFIESSYVTTLISLRKAMHGTQMGVEDIEVTDYEMTNEELGEFAREVIDGLIAAGIHGDQGQLDWIDVSIDPTRDTSSVGPMDAGIYSGRAGMSLLFERAYQRFGERRYLDAAQNSMLMEWDLLGRGTQVFVAPSGMLPTGGMLLAGWRLGAHEEFGIWRSYVTNLIGQIGPNAIERDVSFDIIAGSAGMILVLAHILEEEEIPGARDLVDALAAYLVKHATDQHGGPSWASKGANSVALCGYSHGIAGIALALMHAWKITSKAEYRDIAMRAVACEHGLRSEEHNNWPDFRGARGPDDAKYTMRAWCHGSPGIALGRAGMLVLDDDPMLRDDLEFAMAYDVFGGIKNSGVRPHLCCGSSGLGEIQRTIGVLLGRQADVDLSREITKYMVAVQKNISLESGCMGLGLLQGTAGLAWGALEAEGKVSPDFDLLLLGA